MRAELDHQLLGSTVDDAAGECFDKVGKLIGLPYPAGPEIDRLAESGNPRAYDFPRPMIDDPNDDFSFSGLKTSVRYFLRDHPELLDDAQRLRDLCASVQAAIVDVLVTKTIRAARRLRVSCVTASGGVTCNRALRQRLQAACERERITLLLADKSTLHRQRRHDWHSGGAEAQAAGGSDCSRRGYPPQLGAGLNGNDWRPAAVVAEQGASGYCHHSVSDQGGRARHSVRATGPADNGPIRPV